MEVFKNQSVSDLQSFYGDLLFPVPGITIKQYLERQAVQLWNGIQANDPIVGIEISNYHPDYLGRKMAEIPIGNWKKTDAFQTIASEYGFTDWQEMEEQETEPLDIVFENAVNLLLAGKIEELKGQVATYPNLLKQTSQFGHRATLLHYTGSNGVEAWRQVVPLNLPQVTKFLLEKGVDKHAKMKVYGGEFDTLALLASSGHPYEAGWGRRWSNCCLIEYFVI